MLFNLLLLMTIMGIALYGRNFYLNQNVKSHLGGGISRPKIFWLMYTIFSWFFLPIFLLIRTSSSEIQTTLGGFLILFWVRGIAELLMLYKWKNWRPPYGISHDVLVLLYLLFMQFTVTREFNFVFEGLDGLSMSWIHVTTFTMVIEIYYAYQFFILCRGNTTGKEGVWFADPNDPIYKRINLTTTIFNIPLYLHLLWIVFNLL